MIIEVGYRKISIFTADEQIMPVRQMFTQQRGEIKSVQDVTDFDGLESIDFVFSWGPFKKRLCVDEGITQGVCIHLKLYHAQQDLDVDCYAFANLVRNIPPHKVTHMHEYWDTKPLRSRIRPGDVIFLVNPNDSTFYHAAIYLGIGLYISVWGAGGDIEVATLQDMKTGFNTQNVYIATPRK